MQNEFIKNYLTFTKYTETPDIMHIWTAISCLAGAAERRLWLDRGMFNIHPNLYVVLVGPPGVVAKTTSISFMAKLLAEAGNFVVDQVATKEKIICELVEHTKWFEINENKRVPHASITFAMSELNTLITAGQDMVLFLTAIWDRYDVYLYKTKTSGEFEIVNPYFNMIGAATPDWLIKAIDSDLLSTGFLARCILVYATQKRAKFSKPLFGTEQEIAKRECLDTLLWINSLWGTLEVKKEAEDFYDEWYKNVPDYLSKDPKLGGYFERKAKVFLLKVAMLLALGNKRRVVKVEDFKLALELFDLTEPALKACYLMTGGNKLAPIARNVMRALVDGGGDISYSKMLRSFYYDVNVDELAQVVTMLRNMNLVTVTGGRLRVADKTQAIEFLGEF